MDKEENGADQLPEIEVQTASHSCLGLKGWVLILSGILLILGAFGTFGVAYVVVQRATTMKLEESIITAASLAMWASVVLVVIFGIYATLRENSTLIDAYLWILLTHWFLDLASNIVMLVVAYQKRDGTALQAACAKLKTNVQECINTYNLSLILITCGICLYKILGALTCWFIFRFRKEIMSFEKVVPLTLRFLRRQSSGASSINSITSLFERKKWWSPTEIPVIKIDFASDDSSASTYSNESPGYRQVAFGNTVNYPTLSTIPPAYHASHLGIVNGNGLNVHEIPTLSKYSTVGAERGELT